MHLEHKHLFKEHKHFRQKFLAILQDASDFFVQICVGVFWSQMTVLYLFPYLAF